MVTDKYIEDLEATNLSLRNRILSMEAEIALLRKKGTQKAWRKLTPAQRRKVAYFAQKHGLPRACEEFNVSESAVRFACAQNAVIPKRLAPGDSKEIRVAHARNLIRRLRVTAEDLIS